MNLNDLSTQLMFTVVPIWTENHDGSTSAATAFLYNEPLAQAPEKSVPLLVTCRHVVVNAKRAVVEFVEGVDGKPVREKRVKAEIPGEFLKREMNEALDLALVPMGPFLNDLQAKGRAVFTRSVGPELVPKPEVVSDLSAMEEIVFFGFPSGLRDSHNAAPLIRRGITSTPVWNDLEGLPAFLIDAGVFPGSSGSPVFILNQGAYPTKSGLAIGNRVVFLGILSEAVIRARLGTETYLGLGRVIRSTEIRSAISAFALRIK
ncbi:MAG: hypothetical protein FD180_1935 [Planctomycetota bacterium]|nr:MAG: hypothetical protein FD180_1935 [Planctomycetota bacterium]